MVYVDDLIVGQTHYRNSDGFPLRALAVAGCICYLMPENLLAVERLADLVT
jgi:hypothetical protein